MKTLIEIFNVGNLSSNVVNLDSHASDKYKSLNQITEGNWTYEVTSIESNTDGTKDALVRLYIPGRMMTGIGIGTNSKLAVEDALEDAYSKLFSRVVVGIDNRLEDKESVKEIVKEVVEEVEKAEEPELISFDDAIPFEELEDDTMPKKFDEQKHLEELKAKEERDNSTPIPGSDITQRQIDFMKEFKEYNNIDTEEKFDYYIKTWATHNSVDDITTKKELIAAGRDILENFIVWIKNFQPVLDKGIISPI